MHYSFTRCLAAFALLCLAACAPDAQPPANTDAAAAQPGQPARPAQRDPDTDTDAAARAAALAIRTAVAARSRSARDVARDANRRPAEILEYFGIAPGMRVLDVYSGGGYYAEILAGVVGPEGGVTAHNNQAYLDYAGDEYSQRFQGGRLANVAPMIAENNEQAFDRAQYDAALLILGFHDFFFISPQDGWPEIDRAGMLSDIFHALKSGGVFGVVDHAAASGSPSETGGSLHRIDPEIAMREVTAAGFVFEGEADFLRNPNDDHSLAMSDPDIRGQTDRFVYRFRKP